MSYSFVVVVVILWFIIRCGLTRAFIYVPFALFIIDNNNALRTRTHICTSKLFNLRAVRLRRVTTFWTWRFTKQLLNASTHNSWTNSAKHYRELQLIVV